MKQETICAVSTPPGKGGIAVIRISGEKAIEITDPLFLPAKQFCNIKNMQAYTCAYGQIKTEKGSGYVIKKSLSEDNTIFSVVILVLILWLVFFIYMLPSKIAANNKNASKIYKVNLFLGWIPVIWLILLLAALIGESKES